MLNSSCVIVTRCEKQHLHTRACARAVLLYNRFVILQRRKGLKYQPREYPVCTVPVMMLNTVPARTFVTLIHYKFLIQSRVIIGWIGLWQVSIQNAELKVSHGNS